MPTSITPTDPYACLVEKVGQAHPDIFDLSRQTLLAETAVLPPLTESTLNTLTSQAAEISLDRPRQAYLLMAAAEAAAQHQPDPLLAALAAFQLGRFANEYGRPKLALEAIRRAETQFTALNEPGWLAATSWLRYGLPWALADLKLAAKTLKTAVPILQNSPPPLSNFAPQCLLTLGYVKLLQGDLDDLPDLLERCTTAFGESGDILHQARTLFVHSGYLRRTAPIEKAIEATQAGLALAQSINAAADIGRFYCQHGFNFWLGKADYKASTQYFEAGIELFRSLDIPGWLAQCEDGLAQDYTMIGRLSEATDLIRSAITISEQEEALGQLASIWHTASWLERTKGNYLASLDYLKRSGSMFKMVGNQRMNPISLTGLGDTYLQLGRFQRALQCLEQAFSQLEDYQDDLRLAECGLRLARLWTRLDDPPQAHYYLERTREHAQKVQHASALLAYYLRKAELYNSEAKTALALDTLKEALRLAREQENPSVEIFCRRQLARAYVQLQQIEQAVEQLTLAEAGIKAMDMQHEQAACLLIWGDIYQRQGHHQQAAAAWETAEKISRTVLPDLNWQAAALLADRAEAAGNKEQALSYYRQMLDSLRLLQQGLWQPELAGSYLKRPSHHLNRAVLLSAETSHHQDTLTFIEENKAQTTARQLQGQALFQEFKMISPQAQEMLAEIRWLQEKLRTNPRPQQILYRSAEITPSYGLLLEKIETYSRHINRLQRQQLDSSRMPINNGFEVEPFRQLANQQLGQNWLALDYYRVGSQLVCLLLTPDQATAYPIDLPQDLTEAIRQLNWLKNINDKPPVHILKGAGECLFPSAIQQYLHQDTTLIISPHRDLHHLPWAALHMNGDGYRPLIDTVTPVIIPSLQTLFLLWQRPEKRLNLSQGLLLAVSDFQGRHSALPAVQEEVERLRPYLLNNNPLLIDDDASATALLASLTGPDQLDFWHIASHAFHDGQSGHFSGLALYDRDFLLDEFFQLAPLPNLVTFSACGSSKSRLFEGDEHIGLTTTCLTAGANHVIGSIWNIRDTGIAGIMTDFYKRLAAPESNTAVPVAKALAQAQRQAWKSGKSWPQWAGFRCTGRP